MYKKFFGLSDNPFNIVPDPRYLFDTPETDEAFANLIFGVQSHKGLILLTGEVGTGKTILLKKLVDQLKLASAASAFVFNPRLNPTEFLDYVLSDFGANHESKDKPRMLRTLHQWLIERHRLAQTSVLIVDEAHDLSAEVFEEIRLLSNLETPTDKLIQIIISGQPEIEEKLARPELRRFRQRIALRRKTRPLSLSDTARYISHRFRIAGGDPDAIFSPEATAEIFKFSQGIPRIINLLCEHTLISAYADQQKPAGGKIVEDVAAHLQLVSDKEAANLIPGEPASNLGPGVLSQHLYELIKPVLPAVAPELRTVTPEPPKAAKQEEQPPLVEPLPLLPSSPAHANIETIKTSALSLPCAPPEVPASSQGAESSGGGRRTGETLAPSAIPPRPMEIGIRSSSRTPSFQPSAVALREEAPKRTPERVSASPPADVLHSLKILDRPGANSELAESKLPTPVVEAQPLSPIAARVKSRVARPASKIEIRHEATSPTSAAIPSEWPAAVTEQPSRNLRWTFLVMFLMAVGVGAFYLMTGNRFATLKERLVPVTEKRHVLPANPAPSATAQTGAGNPAAVDALSAPTPATVQKPVLTSAAAQAAAVPPRPEKTKEAALPARPSAHFAAANPPPTRVQSPKATIPKPEAAPPGAPTTGQLLVMSNAPSASVALDGRSDPAWVTPHAFSDLPPGPHEVVVSKPGSNPSRQSVNIEAGKTASLEATLVAASGEIVFATNPPGSEISVDGNAYGASPVSVKVSLGQHTYAASLAGRQTVSGNITVPDQNVVSRNLDLPPTGFSSVKPAASAQGAPSQPAMNVQVTTNPSQATVYADGATVKGQTPISFHLLPGRHTLIIFASGYRPVRREIDVPGSGTTTVSENLVSN